MVTLIMDGESEVHPGILELVEYVKSEKADAAIVMHRPDETFPDEEIPEGWVLVKTERVAGKRVRTFYIPKE